MSQRKHAHIWTQMRSDGQVANPVVKVLTVSWSTNRLRNRVVHDQVKAWAKGIWKNQNVLVDVTVLDTEDGGKITVNGETEACCRFRLELFEPTPRRVFALSPGGYNR